MGGGACCRLSGCGPGGGGLRGLSAVVGLFKLSKVLTWTRRRAPLVSPIRSDPLRDKHGKRIINAPPSSHRDSTFFGVEYTISSCSILPLWEMFYFMLTRYLDKGNVSSSSGAPCPLEETKDVSQGKVGRAHLLKESTGNV